jgi:hypothetical protein
MQHDILAVLKLKPTWHFRWKCTYCTVYEMDSFSIMQVLLWWDEQLAGQSNGNNTPWNVNPWQFGFFVHFQHSR